MALEHDLLRSCTPRQRNSATAGEKHATDHATGLQQTSLKALAMRALARNTQCNNDATDVCNTVQQHPLQHPPVVARVAGPEGTRRAWLIHLDNGQRYPAVTRTTRTAAEITTLMARQFGDRIASVEPWRRPGPDSRQVDRHDLDGIGANVVFGADLESWT